MWKNKKVSVVFSTYNEKRTIRKCIEGFFKTGVVDEVIAVDNNAVKGTKEEIKKTKAKYFLEKEQGIGAGYQRALKEATGDLIITTEVDGTYSPGDIFKILAYSDDFDVVFGTRTTTILIGEGSNMGFMMKWANFLFAKMIEVFFYTTSLSDVGCIYRLISRKAYNKLKRKPMNKGMSYNIDFMLYAIRNNLSFIEVPLNFFKRTGVSHGAATKWKAFKVAVRMFIKFSGHRLNLIKK